MRRLLLLVTLLLLSGFGPKPTPTPDPGIRVWRAVGGTRIRAKYIGYEGGNVLLQRSDGSRTTLRLDTLSRDDRALARELAGISEEGVMPPRVGGREGAVRRAAWIRFESEDPWGTAKLDPRELAAIQGLRSSWRHSECQTAVVHYQEESFAKRVAEMADFFYDYIAADLSEWNDRVPVKSHIVVIRSGADWERFMNEASVAPEWARAYVHGTNLFVPDLKSTRQNTGVIGHEMTHLVLNRLLTSPPPLWLNEGLAEWYGASAWNAFKGRHVNASKQFRAPLADPFPLEALFAATRYPEDTQAFYATSHYLVGFLQLKRDKRDFSRFLKQIVDEKRSVSEALSEVYGYASVAELEREFLASLR